MRNRQISLLIAATCLAAISLSLDLLISARALVTEILLGYAPILLGSVAMWLCLQARRTAQHKTAVLLYTILLAPFAFSYPAWLAFVWIWYRAGGSGPFP
ncbi:MAG TPA: hypothetical protein VFW44_01350 [Bryobacteraceae bacterium]|nr:hypothetical protein [Bryobacteraceae bacterium]